VWPNWTRVSDALRANGIEVDPASLATADPFVRRSLDVAELIAAAADQRRGWNYFERVLTQAGVTLSAAAEAALVTVQEYQRTTNIWEHVPDFVPPALSELRRRGHRLVVVSNANGTLRQAFRRLGLDVLVDILVDSAEEGFEKPDRRIFELALKRAGVQPETNFTISMWSVLAPPGSRRFW